MRALKILEGESFRISNLLPQGGNDAPTIEDASCAGDSRADHGPGRGPALAQKAAKPEAFTPQVTGVPGSPSATTTIDGKQLPPPPTRSSAA